VWCAWLQSASVLWPRHDPLMSKVATKSQLTPCRVGNLYLTLAIVAYEWTGWTTFQPQGDGSTADLIVTRGEIAGVNDVTLEPDDAISGVEIERVQVKSARYLYSKRGERISIEASLRNPTGRVGVGTKGIRYLRSEVDAFCIVTPDGRAYRLTARDLIPPGEDAFPSSVTLRLLPPGNNQTKGVRFASEYEMEVPPAYRAAFDTTSKHPEAHSHRTVAV